MSTPHVHFRAVLPPDFTGDGGESFSQWARRFQVCCETSGMDKPQLAKVPRHASALPVEQPQSNVIQQTGQSDVEPLHDTATAEADCPTVPPQHIAPNSRPLGRRPVQLPARFRDYVVK